MNNTGVLRRQRHGPQLPRQNEPRFIPDEPKPRNPPRSTPARAEPASTLPISHFLKRHQRVMRRVTGLIQAAAARTKTIELHALIELGE